MPVIAIPFWKFTVSVVGSFVVGALIGAVLTDEEEGKKAENA